MTKLLIIFLNLFLKPQNLISSGIQKLFASMLIISGGGIGLFFLFEALVPFIGYIESGASVSALLIIGGSLLLYLNKKKKARPQEDILRNAQDIVKCIDIDAAIKSNVIKILLISLGTGIILSQLKNIKKT
ncbi:MAG: hypothetical protein K2W92_06125 [Alphaproteobacteria bacterium]|nr:hypothetical protein [Alphaproteobacteria bacterium]